MTAALGCVCVAAGVALSAYAAHGAEAEQLLRLERAALFLMLHGAAVAALSHAAPAQWRWILPCATIVLGVLLFSGSLTMSALIGASTVLAPAGGILLMLGWFGAAVAAISAARTGDP